MHDLTKTQVHLQLSLHPPHDLEFARHGVLQTTRACAAWDLFLHLLPSHPFLFPTLFLSRSRSLSFCLCRTTLSLSRKHFVSVFLVWLTPSGEA